jgi:DNA (cytosine-5)-methyltransferase 1
MRFTFIDLFSGCGGLSLGLEQAGFVPVYVNEINSDALNTYLENRKQFSYLKESEFHSKDIHELTNKEGQLLRLEKNLKNKFNIKKGELS